jgi:hypothetical protein
MFARLYLLFGTCLLGLYGGASYMGWEFGGYGRETAEQSTARHASGGHRSTWISGYRGGK